MPDRYTSRIALVLDAPVEDVGALVARAVAAGDIDRAAAVRGQPADAQEVHWGGRLQPAVVRRLIDPEDEAPLLRTEAYIGADGLVAGLRRQAQLLVALARQLPGRVVAVRDLSARVDHDEAWLFRVAAGRASDEDGISVHCQGEGTWWVYTHGAARFDVPDLELYGLRRDQVEGAERAIRHVHHLLLRGGLRAELALPDGTPVYLVPVLDAWQRLPLHWPGIGRAGSSRGPGLDGPRATLSVLHRRRFGRYPRDFEGVLRRL